MANPAIVVFMKWPQPGRVKTRLEPVLGSRGAAKLYEWLLGKTVSVVTQARKTLGVATVAAVTPPQHRDLFQKRLGRDWTVVTQSGRDLGERLANAITVARGMGHHHVVVVGSDCPWLRTCHLKAAVIRLETHDVVLGPTLDGGYYLIGVRGSYPSLFQEIPWSTERVLEKTLAKARALGLKIALLAKLRDVDTPNDLDALASDFPEAPLEATEDLPEEKPPDFYPCSANKHQPPPYGPPYGPPALWYGPPAPSRQLR